jgi:outer membrane protein OmpA-like peptidoglycan-associated protein
MDRKLRGVALVALAVVAAGCVGPLARGPAVEDAPATKAVVVPDAAPVPARPEADPPAVAAAPAAPISVIDPQRFAAGRERHRQQLALAERAPPAGDDAGYYLDVLQARLQQFGSVGIGVQRLGERIVLRMPGPLGFEVGSAQLAAGIREPLATIAAVLVDYRLTLVAVHGHSDDSGPEELNRRISEQRAMAVARALVDGGVEAKRVLVVGHGPAQPLASNASPDGRERNRRVEIELELIAR